VSAVWIVKAVFCTALHCVFIVLLAFYHFCSSPFEMCTHVMLLNVTYVYKIVPYFEVALHFPPASYRHIAF